MPCRTLAYDDFVANKGISDREEGRRIKLKRIKEKKYIDKRFTEKVGRALNDLGVLNEKNVPLTADLLCSACRSLKRLGYDFDENPALSRWWANHQKQDKNNNRIIKEMK